MTDRVPGKGDPCSQLLWALKDWTAGLTSLHQTPCVPLSLLANDKPQESMFKGPGVEGAPFPSCPGHSASPSRCFEATALPRSDKRVQMCSHRNNSMNVYKWCTEQEGWRRAPHFLFTSTVTNGSGHHTQVSETPNFFPHIRAINIIQRSCGE